MSTDKYYLKGELETKKFRHRKEPYYKSLDAIKALGYEFDDLIHHFPCFVGHMTLSRFLVLYECYKRTLGIAGHIADIGTYKGSSLLYFAKLTQIFESEALTQVHGFDWFKGMEPDKKKDTEQCSSHLVGTEVAGTASYEMLVELIQAQSLQHIAFIHKLDIRKELEDFFERFPHLQFKLVFMDAGTYDVTKAAISMFWKRLTKGTKRLSC